MIALNQRITESKDRLAYLIDVFLFEPNDIDLNCEVLTWPKRIMPVFDENDNVSNGWDDQWSCLFHFHSSAIEEVIHWKGHAAGYPGLTIWGNTDTDKDGICYSKYDTSYLISKDKDGQSWSWYFSVEWPIYWYLINIPNLQGVRTCLSKGITTHPGFEPQTHLD